jgi:hypothetical protein
MMLPSYFKLSNLQFGSETNNYVSDSKNLKRNTRSKLAQRWNFSLDIFIEPQDFLKAIAFLNRLETNVQPVEINIPDVTTGSNAGIKTASAVRNQGESQINVGDTGQILEGQMFKFSNHTKVYQVLEIVSSTSILIYPSLRTPIAENTQLNFALCPITAYITSEIPKFAKTAVDSNTRITLDFVELV